MFSQASSFGKHPSEKERIRNELQNEVCLQSLIENQKDETFLNGKHSVFWADFRASTRLQKGGNPFTGPKAGTVQALVAREMEQAAALAVPLTAEAKTGRSWYEAK